MYKNRQFTSPKIQDNYVTSPCNISSTKNITLNNVTMGETNIKRINKKWSNKSFAVVAVVG